jgi:hypothetical protein
MFGHNETKPAAATLTSMQADGQPDISYSAWRRGMVRFGPAEADLPAPQAAVSARQLEPTG